MVLKNGVKKWCKTYFSTEAGLRSHYYQTCGKQVELLKKIEMNITVAKKISTLTSITDKFNLTQLSLYKELTQSANLTIPAGSEDKLNMQALLVALPEVPTNDPRQKKPPKKRRRDDDSSDDDDGADYSPPLKVPALMVPPLTELSLSDKK